MQLPSVMKNIVRNLTTLPCEVLESNLNYKIFTDVGFKITFLGCFIIQLVYESVILPYLGKVF